MSPRKKPILLVTGCNGLLGQKLCLEAAGDYRVVGLDRDERAAVPCDEFHPLDITDRDGVIEAVGKISPETVINTAALTNVDACEKERDLAWAVNVDGVRHLMEGCRQAGAMMVQISSDYVFDGEEGPYGEEAEPHPLGFYGTTKLESERVLASGSLDWAVVRTNVLYGWMRNVRANFALWVITHLAAGKYIRAAIDQYGNPTLADDLAAGVLLLAAGRHRGIYHIAGADYMSRWAFALKIAQVFKLNQELIAPVLSTQLSQRAPRPHWGGLRVDRIADRLDFEAAGVEKGLTLMRKHIPSGEMEGL